MKEGNFGGANTQNASFINNEVNSAFKKAVTVALRKKTFQEGDLSKIQEYISQGADSDYPIEEKRGRTALMLAVDSFHTSFVNFLIKNHADVNACDNRGWTPLLILADKLRGCPSTFNEPIFNILLDNGANLYAKRKLSHETPLLWLIRFGPSNLIKNLIEHGVDINRKDSSGCAPLAWATINEDCESTKILCEAGALIDNIDSINGSTAFHLAVGSSSKHIETLLTSARFNVYKDSEGEEKRKVLAVLSVLSRFPREIKLLIFEKLILIDDDYCSNKKLCEKLWKLRCNGPILAQVKKRVASLEQILQLKNKRGETALDILYNEYPDHTKQVAALFNGSKLQNDWDKFNKVYPNLTTLSSENLVCQMYNNCAELLLEK